MEYKRTIKVYGESFWNFYGTLSLTVQKKIIYVMGLVKVEETIPAKFFKSIENVKGLYEIRIEVESNIYRIFCCFDKEKLVILFNGFQKKSQKTPLIEIERAKNLMKNYLSEKENRSWKNI